MLKGRFILGVLLMLGAFYMYNEISGAITPALSTLPHIKELPKPDQWTSSDKWHPGIIDLCNSGFVDGMFGAWGQQQCIKAQVIYYSPWILGLIGIMLLINSRSNYYGRRTIRYY